VTMAVGVTLLLTSDIIYAFTENLERGVIKALGSLLILWMMIELLHTQVHQLKGGKFHVRIFVDLAMVAFIRKVFVATLMKWKNRTTRQKGHVKSHESISDCGMTALFK